MTTTDTLPEALLFEPDGHLTEAALACVADGETSLVSSGALLHLDGCDHCSRRLGEAALLSVAAGDMLRAGVRGQSPQHGTAPLAIAAEAAPARQPISAPRLRDQARRPLPVAAIAAALVVAALAAGPAIADAIQSVPGTIASAVAAVPFFVRVGAAFVRGAPWGLGSLALLVKCASALVFAAIGLQVARATSRSLVAANGAKPPSPGEHLGAEPPSLNGGVG